MGVTSVAHAAAREIVGEAGTILLLEDLSHDLTRSLVEALAGVDRTSDRPVVVLADDVGPDGDIDAAAAELRRLPNAVLIATAAEPRDDVPSVRVPPLAARDIEALAASIAPGLSRRALSRVAEFSGGRPGWAVDLARVASGWVDEDTAFPFPAEHAEPIRHQLEELSLPARDLVRWAAVLGEPLTGDVLARATGWPESRVEAVVDELIAAALLVEIEQAGRARWRFVESIVGAAIEAGLDPEDRRRRHAAALALAPPAGARPADLLRHALGAEDVDAVIALSLEESRRCRAAGDPADSLRHADRAVAWGRRGGAGCPWTPRMERGAALIELGRWEAAAAVFEPLARELDENRDAEAAVEARAQAAIARWNAGHHDAALALIAEDERVSDHHPSPARARALLSIAEFSLLAGSTRQARRLAGLARRAAEAASLSDEAARALVLCGAAQVTLGRIAGLEELREGRVEAHALPSSGTGAFAASWESRALLLLGRPRQAAEAATSALRRARHEVRVRDEGVLRLHLAEALIAQGELARAALELENATECLRDDHDGLRRCGVVEAWLHLARGDVGESLACFQRLAAAPPVAGRYDHEMSIVVGHALAACLRGAMDVARSVVAEGCAVWREADDPLRGAPLMAVAVAIGSRDEAPARIATLRRLEALEPTAVGAYLWSALAHDAAEAGVGAESFLKAAGCFDDLGMSWRAAQSLMWAGARMSDKDRGSAVLADVWGRFARMGALGWRQTCETLLDRRGRPVATRVAQPAEVTMSPRERDVLRQLLAGLTNREIGTRLYIAERTVARHMARIFAKLGVTTRTAAMRAARERGILDEMGNVDREREGPQVEAFSHADSVCRIAPPT